MTVSLCYRRYQSERREECATVTEAIALALRWEESSWAVGTNVEWGRQPLFPEGSKPPTWARLWDELAGLAVEDRCIRFPLEGSDV